MNVGTESLVDAQGCSPELLRDIETVRGVCEEVIADLGLRVVGEPMLHQFPQPGGVTGLYLLTESHLACHTFPETGLATFNLYCCRPRQRFAWEERLRALLGASSVTVRTAARGTEGAAEHDSVEADNDASRNHDSVEADDDALRNHDSLEAVCRGSFGACSHDSLEVGRRNSLEARDQASFESEVPDSTSAREVSGL